MVECVGGWVGDRKNRKGGDAGKGWGGSLGRRGGGNKKKGRDVSPCVSHVQSLRVRVSLSLEEEVKVTGEVKCHVGRVAGDSGGGGGAGVGFLALHLVLLQGILAS